MKKNCIIFLLFSIIILSALGAYLYRPQTYTEYLRIHIRAQSNAEEDQNVKYLVKEKAVNFLTPYIAQCDTKKKAEEVLNGLLNDIEEVCNGVLKENGFNYTARASVKNEKFPTRAYEEITLESGFYDALIIELGEGKGDNWWCVVYPPLCFTEAKVGYVYKSKIYEIINAFFNNREEK